MKGTKFDWAETFGAVIVVTIIVCVVLTGIDGWARVALFAQRLDAPAWVQAIGSVAAILVAVAVPAWQHRTASQDRLAREMLLSQIAVDALFYKLDVVDTCANRVADVLRHTDVLKVDWVDLSVLMRASPPISEDEVLRVLPISERLARRVQRVRSECQSLTHALDLFAHMGARDLIDPDKLREQVALFDGALENIRLALAEITELSARGQPES